MATSIINNLYPPIIATWMPAFVRDSPCKIYFSLSAYNSYEDIKNVQVMVSNQNSSLTALDTTQYTSEIKICKEWEPDPNIKGDAKYCIQLFPTDMRGGEFEVGQYYKVQIRFTGIGASDVPEGDPAGLAQWLSENAGYFSEWSSVCLIHGIEQPIIYIREFEGAEDTELMTLNSTSLTLTGRMYYQENETLETEYMQSYQVDLYNMDSNAFIYSSGIVYTNEYYPNEINYILKYNLDVGTEYTLYFTYTTNGEYTQTLDDYTFMVFTNHIETINATISATPDEENGRMKIEVVGKESNVFLGNICIRRTSNETNFTVWEDIHIVALEEEKPLDYVWYDYTVKAGIFYEYCVLQLNTDGVRGGIVKIRRPVMMGMDDMFLTRADMQVRLRYDPGISNYKVTLSESKTDTIGSRYPHFMRNGNIAYKEFPITGLIVSYCDSDHLFSSPEEFYGNMKDYYDQFNEIYQVPEYEDFIYERNFREKVMKFLYDDDVKLFRSLTEGNILVRLMNVSFTPNQTLGRMIYSFSATAYEVDECSIDNYLNYGILELGTYSDNFDIEYTEQKLGQISDVFEAGENAVDRIKEHYEDEAMDGYSNIVQTVTQVRFMFQSDPYLIICGSDGSLKVATSSDAYSDDMVYGYIVNINGTDVLVSPRGYYAADPDIIVTSITFPVDTEVNIDFAVDIYGYAKTNENAELQVSQTYFYKRIGQLFGMFDVEDSVSYQIYLKYYLDYQDYFQKLITIDEVTVEADPGTVIYLKDSFDDNFYRHLVGKTRILRLYDEEAVISAMYFGGMHLIPMVDETRLTPNIDEFRDMGITVDDVSEIERPYEHGVYVINNGIETTKLKLFSNIQDADGNALEYRGIIERLAAASSRYIYWHGEWYTITEDNDVLCPVEAIVNYVYEMERGYY